MIIERLELVDFRNYGAASFRLTSGTTVVVGDNGQGKTNFAEALAYLATLSIFRGAPAEALVRVGATAAVIRAEVRDDDGRASLIEAEHLIGSPDPADGRATLVTLAPAGRRLLDELDAAGAEVFDDLTGEFASDELRALAEMLTRLNDRADTVLGIGTTRS